MRTYAFRITCLLSGRDIESMEREVRLALPPPVQIVHDDDIAFFEGRRELFLDVSLEDAPLHRGIDDEGGGEPVAAQAGDKSLAYPMPKGAFERSRWPLKQRPRRRSSWLSFRSRRER
jgi:hypothetical protein